MKTNHDISNMFISRRQFLAATAAIGASPYLSWPAWAAEPYAFKQGDFDISVLSDGELVLPLNVLAPEAPLEELAALIGAAQGAQTFTGQTNIALIRSGNEVILVDNGSGGKFQPETTGKLVENLKAAGVEPGGVTKLVFSHAHPDHIWGTLGADGALVFPNAAYYVNGPEWDFWMAPDILSKMPAEMGDFVKGAQRDLAAVKDKLTMVKPGDDIITGIRVLDTAGHTPGHISLEVSGGEGLIITHDLIASEKVFFTHPDWKFGFDTDGELSAKNRAALLDRAATDKMKLLGYHWTYPGIGTAERKDSAYVFVPAA